MVPDATAAGGAQMMLPMNGPLPHRPLPRLLLRVAVVGLASVAIAVATQEA